ncbi:hypothetical protein [Tessaracoccus coleopterorum]|uniref:hypothetical protein n=1 Tax=Tessaracoccus coleopterorum TaxID=2714950 RepID=UPI0018D2CA89|nr:hypothetical protein [Tessaracoccus coleopterorum]
MLGRDDVDYVSIKVSSVLGQHAAWGHASAVDDAVARLRPSCCWRPAPTSSSTSTWRSTATCT